MFKCKFEATARAIALENGLLYGSSIFGGGVWYVGTEEELRKIGVMDPIDPKAQTP